MQLGAVELDKIVVHDALHVVDLVGYFLYGLEVVRAEGYLLHGHRLARLQVDTRVDLAILALAYSFYVYVRVNVK